MINAKNAELQTSDWVLVLAPTWIYYGLVTLFWFFMLEFPCWRRCTWRSFAAMLSYFAQLACAWLGVFWMARYWDRDIDNDAINWYILSLPFYGAIVFRCYATTIAIASLRDLQACMVSRDRVFPVAEQSQQQPLEAHSGVDEADTTKGGNDNTITADNPNNQQLPDDYIVVTKDSRLLAEYLLESPLSNQDIEDVATSQEEMDKAVVATSPEFRQVDHAIVTLRCSGIQLAVFGVAFILLLSLKLEGELDVSFWLVFLPLWVYLGMKLYRTLKCTRTKQHRNRSTTIAAATANNAIAGTNAATNRTTTSQTANATVVTSFSPTTVHSSKEATGISSEQSKPAIDGTEGGNEHKMTSVSLVTGGIESGEISNNNKDVVLDTIASMTQYSDSLADYAFVQSKQDGGDTSVRQERTTTEQFKAVDEHAPSLSDIENGLLVPITPVSAVQGENENVSPSNFANDDTTADSTENEHEPNEEFERWQSVYEYTEVRNLQSPLPSCEVFFSIMITCLIVAKLDHDYGNTDPNNPGFNAFFIILIPFCLALIICICAIAYGCAQLTREEYGNSSRPTVEAPSGAADATGIENITDAAEPLPMEAGGVSNQPMTFSANIDIQRPDLTISDRVHLFTAVMPLTDADAEAWLVENNATYLADNKSLWEQTIGCASDLECTTVNYDDDSADGVLAGEFLALLRKNLQAHFDKSKFEETLDAIQPLDCDESDDIQNGVECPICCEEYKMENMVHCEGENPIHFFCRMCFYRYATETIDSGSITGIPCADANCQAFFATPTVRDNVSSWDALRMEDRETERNTKVALAATAVLKCKCGCIAVVEEKDVGDGCITCPGSSCGRQFCANCGNKWHPDTPCPPTKKMLEWVVSNTMPCPNCHTPIEKNAGCDHMYCAPPGGCGHHFSYRTGKPMSRSGTNIRSLYG